jgi:hypothetical protein
MSRRRRRRRGARSVKEMTPAVQSQSCEKMSWSQLIKET